MDHLLVLASEAKELAQFEGTTESFRRSSHVVDWCIQSQKIVRLLPQDMSREERERYTDYLVAVFKGYLKANPKISSWSEFASRPENNKVAALFHQFGVRGEVFGVESYQTEDTPKVERSRTNLTFQEFYEMCQIQFHYQGSFGSFKKLIARKYGSFAEYCILRGYDINGTKWENDETAIRVAKKLGSMDAIRRRAASLHKYLSDKNLLDGIFENKAS